MSVPYIPIAKAREFYDTLDKTRVKTVLYVKTDFDRSLSLNETRPNVMPYMVQRPNVMPYMVHSYCHSTHLVYHRIPTL